MKWIAKCSPFSIFCTMKTYVLKISYKELWDNEWLYKNEIIEANNVKEAINKVHEKMKGKANKIIIDFIYGE